MSWTPRSDGASTIFCSTGSCWTTRAYRQYGVYHATKVLMDLYSMTIAKLGTNDRESEMLYKARLNSFAIDPRSFMFPSAESSYKKGLKLIEQYKESLDKGTGVYNCRTDDLYASFDLVIGENLLGYALGLLENSQELPFYTLDNRIYEVQGIVLVVRDFISALYELYPEISSKGNAGNMAAAIEYMNRICTYDPLYITSKVNSGELIISYVLFAQEPPRRHPQQHPHLSFLIRFKAKGRTACRPPFFVRLPETGGYAP